MTLLAELATAVQFMTRVPTPGLKGEAGRDLAGAAPWLPVAGAIVGATLAFALFAAAALPPLVAGLIGLLAWIAVTGALHIEGMGDVADALGAAHANPERFLAVARDPHVGGFGAVAMIVQVVAKLVLLAALADTPSGAPLLAIALVAVWARWGTLLLAWLVPPLAPGLGQSLAQGVTPGVVILEAAALGLVSLFLAPVLLAAPAVALALAAYWRRALGGMTGDCHGASIEITETALLFLLVVKTA